MNTTYGTDIDALATEALNHEGVDAYHGATAYELAEFMAARFDLWTPATDDAPWVAHDGFDEALADWMHVSPVEEIDRDLASAIPATIDIDSIDANEATKGRIQSGTWTVEDMATDMIEQNYAEWIDGYPTDTDADLFTSWAAALIGADIRRDALQGVTWTNLDSLVDAMQGVSFPAELPAGYFG